MKQLITIAVFILTIQLSVFAQQEPQFSHNMFNQLSINPGYAGLNDAICADLFYRPQWVGFSDNGAAAKTMAFNIHMPVPMLYGGLGLSIVNDQIGYYNDIGVRLSYSYHHSFNSGIIGGGLRFGLYNKGLKDAEWQTPEIAPGQDPAIPDGNVTQTAFNIGFGAFYKSYDDKIQAGFASTQLLEPKLSLADGDSKLKRHYYIYASYKYPVLHNLDIVPSVAIKTDASAAQIDLNILAEYNNWVWGGVSFRPGDAVIPMIGIYPFKTYTIPSLKAIKFGYAYDVTLSDIKNYSSGTHEIFLGYCFTIERPYEPTIYINPRTLGN